MSGILNISRMDPINPNLTSLNYLESNLFDNSEKKLDLHHNATSNSYSNQNIKSHFESSSSENKMMKDLEELKKINSEILNLEKTVHHLEFSKKLKLIKIDCLREIIERVSLEDAFISVKVPFDLSANKFLHTEIKAHFSYEEKENENCITFSQLANLNRLTIENFSKSTLDQTHESIFNEEECEEESLVSQPKISNANEDDRCCMQRCFLFWKEHLPAQKRI